MGSPNAFPPCITLDERVRNVDIAAHVRCSNTASPTGGPLRVPIVLDGTLCAMSRMKFMAG